MRTATGVLCGATNLAGSAVRHPTPVNGAMIPGEPDGGITRNSITQTVRITPTWTAPAIWLLRRSKKIRTECPTPPLAWYPGIKETGPTGESKLVQSFPPGNVYGPGRHSMALNW